MATSLFRQNRLRLLLDANVLIAIEPYAGEMESGLAPAARVIRAATEQGHVLLVHPAVRDDIAQDHDWLRRQQRLAELNKYPMLIETPIPATFRVELGEPTVGSNDDRDMRLLAALQAHAATHLVSEDLRLRRKAIRVGLGDAVLSVAEAATLLEELAPKVPEPPPHVRCVPTYVLNPDDPIFDGLRADYSEFDIWLDRVRSESDSRLCFIVEHAGAYAAIALLKPETQPEHRTVPAPTMKISTFKVADDAPRARFGELLLKALLPAARERGAASVYVEVLPRHEQLMLFFTEFGFTDTQCRTDKGEQVFAKPLLEPDRPDEAITDVEYQRRYGPPALLLRQRAFVVPIQPQWHIQLFPDATPGDGSINQPLLPGIGKPTPTPWGNAIRKAYLCNAMIRLITPGDVLLFYRSRDTKGVTAAGIVEETLVSHEVAEIVTFVGRRTVYSPAQIENLARSVNPVLAITFRQDRFIDPPWYIEELRLARVVRSAPQTIVCVREEGMRWVSSQLRGHSG